MLRGLAIRQGLIALNGALAAVFVVILLLMGREMLRGSYSAGAISKPDLSSVRAPALSGPARSATDYDALLARGMFGDAGRYERGAKPSEPALPPPTETQETQLPLKLFGTALSYGDSRLSAAIIEVRDGSPKTSTFYPNDQVMEQVILKEVRRQEVILENRRTNTTESLRIDWAANPVRLTPALASRPVPGSTPLPTNPPSRVDLVSLDREAITKKLEDEYARVSATLNVKVINDDNGRAKGITTDNIENFETAKELGFKNGDVLVSLNNEPVDSKEKAVEVLKKYRNASLFRVGLMRDGQMMYKTYRVK